MAKVQSEGYSGYMVEEKVDGIRAG